MKSRFVQSVLSGVLLLATPCAFAQGSGAKGGGDVELIRKEEIKTYINSNEGLKHDLISFFNTLNPSTIDHPEVRAELDFMLKNDVVSDILKSEYQTLDYCEDKSHSERSASTVTAELGASVCFNLNRLSLLGVKTSELIGLAAHEEARHFGFEDTLPGEGHPIGAWVANSIRANVTLLPPELMIAESTVNGSGDSFKKSCSRGFAIACKQAQSKCILAGYNPISSGCERNVIAPLPGDGCEVQAITQCKFIKSKNK